MSQQPFPSPDELDRDKQRAATGEIDRLRGLVRTAFAEQDREPGSAYSVQAEGISSTARDTVFAELRAAGWHVELGGQRDQRGEFFISRSSR